ncbi:hypothetical protein [Nonomuraea bangladeshensis]
MRRWADGEDEVWKVFAMDGDSYPRRYPKHAMHPHLTAGACSLM